MKPLIEFVDAEGRQRSYYIIESARTYTVEYCLGDDYSFRHRVTVEYSREVAIRSLAAVALLRLSESHELKIHCLEVEAAMNAIREERRADDEQRERERAEANLRRLERLRLDTEALAELRKEYRLVTKPGTAAAKLWNGKDPDTTEPIAGQVAGEFIIHEAPTGKLRRITHTLTGVHLGVDLPVASAKLLTAILLKRFDWNTTKFPPAMIRESQAIVDLVKNESWNELRQRLLTAAIHG